MAKTLFSDGNPLQGILGTIVNAAFLNKIFSHRHDGQDLDGSAPLDYAVDQGAANVYVVALTPALTAHVEGLPIHFKASSANTGASTLNINNLGAKSIIMPDGSALAAGVIKADQMVTVIYTGDAYMIVSKTSDSPILVGMHANFPCISPPAGWLKRNGALLSRTTYANLYAFALASGNMAASDGVWQAGQFSPGDGATTFRIPDGRGEFERGWDDGRGVDVGRGIGSWQADDFKNHTHTLVAGGGTISNGNGTGLQGGYSGVTGSTGGVETRPRNVACLACIKY